MGKRNRTSQEPSEREMKRQQFAAPAAASTGPSRWSWQRWLTVGLLAVIVLYILNLLTGSIAAPWRTESGAGTKTVAAVQANSAGEIRISTAALANGAAQFYEFASPSLGQVRFFLVKDSRGTIRTAIDNCEVCFEARRGYTQQGEEMVCGKCGQSFPIDRIGDAAGGCHPIALPATRSGDEVVIRVADLGGSGAARATPLPLPSRSAVAGPGLGVTQRDGNSKVVTSVQPTPAGDIRIPAAGLSRGAAQFYEYADSSGKHIRFFAILDPQGIVRTALDGCEECYQANKGYTQRGQEMLCGECGKGSPIAAIDEAAGGCHPTFLPSARAGEEIVVKVADVVAADARTAAAAAGPVSSPGDDLGKPVAAIQASSTGEIRVPTRALADGTAQFYEYASPFGGQVRFFVVQDSQGGVHAAIDNCEECYQARKGYTQRAQEMVCRKCGKAFPIGSIRQGGGGCRPIGLPALRVGDELVLKAVDLVTLDAGAASAAGRSQAGQPRF